MKPLCSNFKDFKKTVILGESGRASAGWGPALAPWPCPVGLKLQPLCNQMLIFLQFVKMAERGCRNMQIHEKINPSQPF